MKATWISIAALTIWGCGIADNTNENGGTFAHMYESYLNQCAQCHASNAPGRTPDTEATLDFSTVDKAFATLHGTSSGLQGNVQACNGVGFIGSSYETSLLAAVLDENVRANFNAGACTSDEVTDMTVKIGPPPSGFLNELRQWINEGAGR